MVTPHRIKVAYPNLVHIYCQIGRISEVSSDTNKLSKMSLRFILLKGTRASQYLEEDTF